MTITVGAILGSGLPLVVLVWVVALATRLVRDPRFLVVLVAWSVVLLRLATLTSGSLRSAIIVAGAAVALAIVLWPGRLGLAGPRGAAAEADATLRRASAWLRGTARDAAEAESLSASLAPGAFPVPRDEWAVAASLFRLAVHHAVGSGALAARTSGAYAGAGRSWWRAATERHLLGPRFHPRPYDEHLAIRAAYERFIALVPLQAITPDALIPIGGWDDEAEHEIARLTAMRLRAPVPLQARDALVTAMRDHLAIARGDRSPDAYARQAASAVRMQEAWDALAAMS